jgi:hypothetical protein
MCSLNNNLDNKSQKGTPSMMMGMDGFAKPKIPSHG